MLEITHQGTNSIKEIKINILVQQHEIFKIHSNETITQMFARFTTITNDLNALEKSYTSTKLVNKILRSLPKAYQKLTKTKWWQFERQETFQSFLLKNLWVHL